MLVETIEHKNHKIKIYHDDNAESPREWDNLGTMVSFHRRYTLGDKHNFHAPQEVIDYVKKTGAVCLPIYAYEHGGITINTTGFSCPWDSGQVGFIFIEREKILKEYGKKRLTKKFIEKIKEYLNGEVKTLDQYLQGDIYGYEIYDSQENCVDSCWGFYGVDNCIEEAKGMVPDAPNSVKFIKENKIEGLL